jgi:hypothetical protein
MKKASDISVRVAALLTALPASLERKHFFHSHLYRAYQRITARLRKHWDPGLFRLEMFSVFCARVSARLRIKFVQPARASGLTVTPFSRAFKHRAVNPAASIVE